MKQLEEQSLGAFFGLSSPALEAVRGRVIRRRAAPLETVMSSTAVLQAMLSEDWSLLITIEADMDPNGFRNVVDYFFGDPSWNYGRLYFIPEILKAEKSSTFEIGSITFEAEPLMLDRMLRDGERLWQCINQRIGGVVVDCDTAPSNISLTPFRQQSLEQLAGAVRSAFTFDNDLVDFAVFVRDPGHEAVASRVRKMMEKVATD